MKYQITCETNQANITNPMNMNSLMFNESDEPTNHMNYQMNHIN